MEMKTGRINSFETFGSVDGPGVRYVIFMQGCRLRCRYCHNVDTWALKPEEAVIEKTAREVLNQALRYKTYWGSDGGITVSGGEPLLQIDFLLQLFELAKENGINTCLDTALEPFTREEPFFSKFNRLLGSADLIMADIKHIDPQKHVWLTGRSNENILDCLSYLSQKGVPVWIRHVLVPGITDDDAYLRETRHFIETLENVKKTEILPYHSLGINKWDQLGIPYSLRETKAPSEERIKNAEDILLDKK